MVVAAGLACALLSACGSNGQADVAPPSSATSDRLGNNVMSAVLGGQLTLSRALACETTRAVRAPMGASALYARDANGACVAANLEGADLGHYYTDAACTQEIPYRPPSYLDFCTELLTPQPNTVLGNAAAWLPDPGQPNDPLPAVPSQKWTLAYGAQLDIGAESLAGESAPFMKRFRFTTRPARSGSGTCELEMRIYKKDIGATNLAPLLAIHGGSWSYRGGAFYGLESQISHYTDAGFIVFAPFYRLAGTSDGNAECNGVTWQEITQDVGDALDWVRTNGPALGASAGPVAVMGQSAGAFLAAWLVAHRPQDVSRGLLLYPPTDALDFIRNARPGGLYAQYGSSLAILSQYLGIPNLDTIDPVHPPVAVTENSLLAQVGASSPPLFIIHGVADTVIPSNQSVLMCNAYGGSAINDGGAPAQGVYERGYACGAGQLHLVAQGDHALDLMCVPGLVCPAGSLASEQAVAGLLGAGRAWLRGGA